MRKIKYIEIKDMKEDQKWKVGDKLVFHTGRATKEQISLTQMTDGLVGINFHVPKEFEVEREPYTYICVVTEINAKDKIDSVRLVRKYIDTKDGMSQVIEYPEDDHPFKLFAPFVFHWRDLFFFETYVIYSLDIPFTPLMGVACAWDYDGDLEDTSVVLVYKEK